MSSPPINWYWNFLRISLLLRVRVRFFFATTQPRLPCVVNMTKQIASLSFFILVVELVAVFSLSVPDHHHHHNNSNSNSNSSSSSSNSNDNALVEDTAKSKTTNKMIAADAISTESTDSRSKSKSVRGKSAPASYGANWSKKHSSSNRVSHDRSSPLSSLSTFPFVGYRYKYASSFDNYDLDTDIDIDGGGGGGDIDLHEPIWFPLHYDVDLDLDLDFDDIDLDLDLLKLKYGLYGLNHYSLHNPRFNDYRFRRVYRLRSRPYFRPHHRYLPEYWKHDLDFWGLDNYGLGFSYDKYSYFHSFDTPTSYSSGIITTF